MTDTTPEQRAREQIDDQLVACGWIVQRYKGLNLAAGRGIALCEVPLKFGTCDNPRAIETEPDEFISRERALTLERAAADIAVVSAFTHDLDQLAKANLDIFWLKDEALEESANLPSPDVIAQGIVADLEADLEQFSAIAEDLSRAENA